jgi:hypothetical protein
MIAKLVGSWSPRRRKSVLHQSSKILCEEARLGRLRIVGNAGVESADRIAAALSMRIVGREHKEPIVGLADEFADVFEGIGRKAQLVVDLFRRSPLHFAQMRLGL